MDVFPSLVECKNCGLVYINPRWIFLHGVMPYDEEAEGVYFKATTGKRTVAFKQLIAQIKNKYHLPTYHALDIGCGDGLMLELCKLAGIECDGFEVSDSLVRELQSKHGENKIYTGSLDWIPEKNFDVVFLINVIEHLSNPVLTLAQIYRLLKPSGIVFIHAPNYGGLPAKLFGARWHQIEPLGHLYYYNRRTLVATIRQAGYNLAGYFYLKSYSPIKSTIQYLLEILQIHLDNGLGIVAQKPEG
jgi:2-polyprenyl-3-methyl-5-hydroxy-6-metoxy-1,4-benzoquinol methylase